MKRLVGDASLRSARPKMGGSAGQRWAVPLRRKPRCLLFIVPLEIGDTSVNLDNFLWHAKIFSR
jgi:hypothetical protein